MLTPYLLFSLLFTVARTYAASKHSGDVRQRPSCEQLQEFWDEITQANQIAEITNEIPILPPKFQNAMDRVLMTEPMRNTPRGNSHKKTLEDKPSYFPDISDPFLQYPVPEHPALLRNNYFLSKQQAPLNDELNGVFGEFHEQAAEEPNIVPSKQFHTPKSSDHTKPEVPKFESLPGLPLGNKKNDEVEFFIPQWGSPEDVDTFGSFIDLDFSSPYLPMTRTPKGVKGQWSDITREGFPQTCDIVMNSNCRTKDDCSCKGWQKLTCIQGKCLAHGNPENMSAKYGIWHDGPIPHSELQLLTRRRKRSYRTIFM